MPSIAIIGAGPAGLCAGLKLKEAGFDDFVIFEQASGIGGTWLHNSYPGCRCDVPSILYCFSFAADHPWTERYATQPEILAYLEGLAERGGLLPHLRLDTSVQGLRWLDDQNCWLILLPDGRSETAQIVFSAIGLFNAPHIPQIPGLEAFAGPVMHSARWDKQVEIEGRRIAVIGSAASAVQIVPEIAQRAADLCVYQRSPNHVRPREPEMSRDERNRFWSDPALIEAERKRTFAWIDSVCEMKDLDALDEAERACLEHVACVADQNTRAALTPDYPFGSKRPLVSSQWYTTFNLPHVHLVTEPIQAISSKAIFTADGQSRETDAIVLATGFQTTRFLSAISVEGRGGMLLDAAWAEGAFAYRGITMRGLPNLFMLYGPNTNNGVILFNIEHQVEYALRHIAYMTQHGIAAIDVREEPLAIWNADVRQDISAIAPWNGAVRNYYRAANGRNVTQWPHGMHRYAQELARPDFDAYETIGDARADLSLRRKVQRQ